ncbi:hypothetical protein ABPG74_020469 [Tetrahymena malaccensis]
MKGSQIKSKLVTNQEKKSGIFNRISEVFINISHQKFERKIGFDYLCSFFIVISYIQLNMYLYFPTIKKVNSFENQSFTYNRFHEALIYAGNPQLYLFEYVAPEIYDPKYYSQDNLVSSSSVSGRLLTSKISSSQEFNQKNQLINKRLLQSQYSQSDFGFQNLNSTNSTDGSANSNNIKRNLIDRYDEILSKQLSIQLIITLVFILIISIITSKLLDKITKGKHKIRNTSQNISYLDNILYYFFHCYNYIILMPLIQTILLCSQFSSQEENSEETQESVKKIFIQIFSILNLILTILFSLNITQFSEQSLLMESNGLIRLNRTNLYAFSNIIKIVCTFYFSLIQSNDYSMQNTAKYLQLIFIAFYLIISLIDVIFNFPFSSFTVIGTFLICLIISFSSLVLYIFWNPLNVLSDKMHNLLLILSVFLNMKLILVRKCQFFERIFAADLADIKQDKNVKYKIYYKISLLLSEINILCQDQKQNFIVCGLLQSHIKSCQNQYCYCQNFTSSYEQSNETERHKQVNIIYSQSFYQAYMYDLLEKFKKVLQLNKSEDQLFFCHYAMALCRMDRYSKSLQQLFYLNDQITKNVYENNAANINYLVQSSLPILMNQVRNQFILTFQQQVTKEEEDVKICTEKFQKVQRKKDQIKSSLTKAIQNKLLILEKIVKNSYSSNQNFFDDAKALTCQLDKIQKDIYRFYNEFPSYDQKLILTFFLSEIRNDLYGAQIVNKQVCMEDEFFVRVLRNSKINYFSEKVCIFKVGYGSEKGKLNWYSKNSSNILMLSEETLKYCSHINDLIPNPIRDHHNQIVQNFLKTGKSKSFRKLSKIYIRDKLNYAQECIIFFDIDSLQLNDLSLITFIKPIRSYSSTISLFFDFDGNLQCSTPNIWSNLYQKEEMVEFEKSHLHNLSWYSMFPKIQEYIASNQGQERNFNKFFKVKMFLPKESSLNAKSQSASSFNVPKIFHESQKNQSSYKQKGFIEFEATLNVIEQPYQNKYQGRYERYYIFELDDIKKIRDDSTSGNSTSFTKLDSSFKTNTADNVSVNSGVKITNGLETEQNTNEDEADHIKQQNLIKNKIKSLDAINQTNINAQYLKNVQQNQVDQATNQAKLEQQQTIQLLNQSKIVTSSSSDCKQQLIEKSPTFKNQSSTDLGKIVYQGQNRDQFSPCRSNNNSTNWTFNNFVSSEEVIPIRDQKSASLSMLNGSQTRAKKSSSIHQENNKNLEVIQEHVDVDSKSPRESDRKDSQSADESFQYQFYNINLQKEFVSDHHEKANKYFQQDLDLSPVQLNPTSKFTIQTKQQENQNNNHIEEKENNSNKIDVTYNNDATKLDFKYNHDTSNFISNKNNSQSNQYFLVKNNQELNDLKQFQDLSKQEIKLNFDLSNNYDYSIKNQINKYQETDYKELEIISIDRNYGIKEADRSNQILQNQSFYENLKSPQNQSLENDALKQQQINANQKISQQIFYENKSEESSSDSNHAQQDKNQIMPAQYYGLNSPTIQFVSPRDINQQILQLSGKNLLNSTSEETTGVSLNNQSYLPFSQNQLISPKNTSFQQIQGVEKIEECITEEDDENDTQHKKRIKINKQDLNQKLFFQSRIKSQYYDKSYKKRKQNSKRQRIMESMEVTSTNHPNMDQKEEEANQIKNNYQNSVANTSKFGRYQFLQKYQKLHYFMESKSNPKSLMYFLYLRIVELIASIILISSFTIFIKTLINNHQSNIQILKYQSEFLGPLDQGFGCIWQGVNYYFQMATKVRNYTTYKQRIDFIAANINYTYTNLKAFSETDESNPVILEFLDSQTYLFQPDGYKNVNTVLQYNRLIIYQLVKAFRYISNWDWDQLTNVSVYEFDVGFLNANIMSVTNLFSNISQQTMDSLENDVNNQNQQILIILIVMMLVFCILSAISTSYYVKYLRLKEALIELFRYIDKVWADNEIERSKKSLQQIENYNNLNFLNGYIFSLEEKDTHLCSMEDKKNQSIKSYRQGNNSKSFKIVQKRFVNKVLILIMYFLFVAGTTSCLIGVYIYNTQYINNYVNACKTYQKFADSHSLVSRLTGLQEYYYSISANWFRYMNNSNITAAIPQYTNLLLQAQNFVSSELQNTQNLGSSQYLDDFQNFIVSLQNTNLCTQILNMQGFNLILCQQIQSGSMQTGIITTLTQMLNDLNFEEKTTKFNITQRNPRYPNGDHLEAGIMCTRILKYASDILNKDIQLMIDNAWKIMLLMTILFLMFMLVLNISLVFYGYYYFVQDYKYTKRCLLLLPLNTLILENSFNSNLRILYLQNDLMDEQ